MKALRNISLILLLSFSALILHNLVPHHHHLEVRAEAHEHECPGDGHAHDRPGEKHCHAFNDVVFLKHNQSWLPGPVKVNFDFAADIHEDVVTKEKECGIQLAFDLKTPLEQADVLGLQFLRAPPYMS